MGIYGGLFGDTGKDKKEKATEIPWNSLNVLTQIAEIKEASNKRPQVIFKHSTTCGISRMVLNMFKSGYSLEKGQMDFHFLDLLANRDLSNAIASAFGVTHQSPQLLIVKNGVVVKHDSHGAISEIDLKNYL